MSFHFQTSSRFRLLLLLFPALFIIQSCSDPIPWPYPEEGRAYSDFMPCPKIPFAPHKYICYRTNPLLIDGELNENSWSAVPWSENFSDISGDPSLTPRYRTRMKMLWDSQYLYVAAELEEPHIWATLVNRDDIIFYDNDFEVFIDPNSDTHEYFELEMNAFNTVWDLFLSRPYRDGGPAMHHWDIHGLITAVHLNGTVNQPGDTDRSWQVEIAIPWQVLAEAAHTASPPEDGDQWRMNFSRVQWETRIVENQYEKITDPSTGRPFPEANWVWSPQGLVNMHYPEMWGIVQFSNTSAGTGPVPFKKDPGMNAQWALRLVYYQQQNYFRTYGKFAEDFQPLSLPDLDIPGYTWPPSISVSPNQFEAAVSNSESRNQLVINHE